MAEDRWFISRPGELEPELADMVRQIGSLRTSAEGALFTARIDGRMVGFLSLRAPPWERTRHVVKLEIAVSADARGQGVGRALMEAAVQWAEQAPGVEKIGLSVFADNERALALYRAFGFRTEGRREREYRLDDGTYRDDLLLYRFV